MKLFDKMKVEKIQEAKESNEKLLREAEELHDAVLMRSHEYRENLIALQVRLSPGS
jgi:hypothetical protein